MPTKFSIIIICKNAADTIDRTLQSVRGVSDDIVVYDSGSTDDTVRFVEGVGLPVHRGPWLGFGATRRAATELARYDWVFCLDADEWMGVHLADALAELTPRPGTAYSVRLANFLGKRRIRWGGWGRDRRVRYFHRREYNWNLALIHEKVLPLGGTARTQLLPGSLFHRTARSVADYRAKLRGYAPLVAEAYRRQGRKPTLFKQLLSPLAAFCKDYFLRLGLLEGVAGFQLAWAAAGYTWRKYQYLKQPALLRPLSSQDSELP
ncbi:glycosyltransferase family 2 protein [Flaviaesturariibacter aridisoli]|nr:glycosyltransferase family 2 protein [Flaviaesturariibacter aridisoli]